MYATVKAKGKALKHIAPIRSEYLEKYIQVILIYGEEEVYDAEQDPDWVLTNEDDERVIEQSQRDFLR